MAEVHLQGVGKQYRDTAAVVDVTLSVAEGELVTLLGPSGCGKTTTLRMVAGFLAPSAGRILIGERVVSDPRRRILVPPNQRHLGMVFQSYAVWPHMTVFENVAYPLKVRRVSSDDRRRRVAATLELVKLGGLAPRYPHQLSGGQQQRVALARALVVDPAVLLLDEPLSNLDAKLREEMRDELKVVQRQVGATILFVTHDQVEAMALSDRVVVMAAGAVQQIGTPVEIYERPANHFVASFVGAANLLPARRVPGERAVEVLGLPGVRVPIEHGAGEGEAWSVLVRPEAVRLAPPGGDGGVRARVNRSSYSGDTREYVLTLQAVTPLRARVPAAAPPFGVGDEVAVSLTTCRAVPGAPPATASDPPSESST